MGKRINLNPGTDAQQRGWGSGWPNCQEDKMVWAKAGGIGLSVHRDIAPLSCGLIELTVKKGYRLDQAKDDWGFACRAIAGTKTASNHSWGIAHDLNANKNPYTSGNLVTDMPKWMPKLWNKYGYRWGGDYNSVKDAMHYEFMGTPKQARKLWKKFSRRHPAIAAKVRKELKG